MPKGTTNGSNQFGKDRNLFKSQVPPDVDQEDAATLVDILQTHSLTRFRRARTYDHWNDIIRCCDPNDGRITQLSLFGFECRTSSLCGGSNVLVESRRDLVPITATPLSRFERLEKLELRHCRSLPVADLPLMMSLKWLNLCIIDSSNINETNFLIPNNRDWYPPNMKTFLIYGYKVRGDPLDALIATSLVIQCPPIEIEEQNNCPRGVTPCMESDIRDVLLSDGIGPFVTYDDRTGRIIELRLSSVVPNTFLQRSTGVELPATIGRLKMLQKLYLYNISSVPKELSRLMHLRVLRLDGCAALSSCPKLELPCAVELQIRNSTCWSILKWIPLGFPSLRSLSILNVSCNSLELAFELLGGTLLRGFDIGPPVTCFRETLTKLHVSALIADVSIPNLEKALLDLIRNHPNLSELYVERVGGDKQICLESLMTKILEQYPRVRGLSIGGPNIFTFDKRNCRRRSYGKAPVANTESIRCDILLNQNRCGRSLLNTGTAAAIDAEINHIAHRDEGFNNANQNGETIAPRCHWIPLSVWSRVLERAQKLTYSGNIKNQHHQTIQRMSALYFLLRNGPALAMREQFGFVFSSVANSNRGDGRRAMKRTRRVAKKRKYTYV